MKRLLPLLFCMTGALFAASGTTVDSIEIDIALYGWLDQYSMNRPHYPIGDVACTPTSSTNGMTYLQNAVPYIFGTTLTGSSYESWMATCDKLIKIMGTTIEEGTFDDQMVYGLDAYIRQIHGYQQVQFSGQYPSLVWSPPEYPQPLYIQSSLPTPRFMANALAAGSTVLLALEYPEEGGHQILANGMTWDTETASGEITFVDPLDPSQNYSPEEPLGPAKATKGEIWLAEESGEEILILDYEQYQGSLPYEAAKYKQIRAGVSGILSIGGAMAKEFGHLVKKGNPHLIAKSFDRLDPTTKEMFPVLAVLNSSTDEGLYKAFNEFDPSLFNNILFAEENAMTSIQSLINRHLLQYFHTPHKLCTPCQNDRFWLTPFVQGVRQDARGDTHATSGYTDTTEGLVGGIDHFFGKNLVAGVGLSYANTRVQWLGLSDAGSHLKGYQASLYAAWKRHNLGVNATLTYSHHHTSSHRDIRLHSPNTLILPLHEAVRHQSDANIYYAHVGTLYDLWKGRCRSSLLQIWPYLNLDAMQLHQASYHEFNGGALDLGVQGKTTSLFRPELGVGSSLFQPLGVGYWLVWQATLSYVGEFRWSGRDTTAFFLANPDTSFTLTGPFPQNNLFSPGLQVTLLHPCQTYRLLLTYVGAFGSGFSSNEGTLELSFSF